MAETTSPFEGLTEDERATYARESEHRADETAAQHQTRAAALHQEYLAKAEGRREGATDATSQPAGQGTGGSAE